MLNSFAVLGGWTNDHPVRIRGYLHPPVAREYVFTTRGKVDLILGDAGKRSSTRQVVSPDDNRSEPTLLQKRKYYVQADCTAMPDGSGVTIGWQLPDGNPNWGPTPGLMYLSRAFDAPLYAWTYRDRFPDAVSARSILWHDARGSQDDLLSLPLDRYFGDAEVVYLRESWDDSDAAWVGFAATDNWDFIHGQLDQGTFVYDVMGERWATDFGADNYGMPGYWDKDLGGVRWKAYRIRAEGHNTLVINPGSTHEDQHPRAKGKMVEFCATNDDPFAIADLTDAHRQNGALRVRRGCKLVHRRALLVQDEVTLDAPSEVWWFLHTRAEIDVKPGGRSATLGQGDKQVQVTLIDGPEDAELVAMDAAHLESSPGPTAGERGAEGVRKLAVAMEGVRGTACRRARSPRRSRGACLGDRAPRFLERLIWANHRARSPWSPGHRAGWAGTWQNG